MGILGLLALTFVVSCKGKTASPADPGAQVTVHANETVNSIRYYKGGWYGLPPNWKYDLTIDFTKFVSGNFQVSAKHPDALCFKAGTLSLAQANALLAIYSQMQLQPVPPGPVIVDLGEESIEIKTLEGHTYKYYLEKDGISPGQTYVINPTAMRDFMENLDASLAIACQ